MASIWDRWTDPTSGEIVTSFSMLTVNADGHPVMGRFHRPGDEKRSVVVLAPEHFQFWLRVDLPTATQQLTVPPAHLLTASPVQAAVASAQSSLF